MKRITRRQQYINSLEFDLEFHKAAIAGKKYYYWYQGEFINKNHSRKAVSEIQEEIRLVKENTDYKPFVDLY